MSQKYRVIHGKVYRLNEIGDAYIYDGSLLQYQAKNLTEYLEKKSKLEYQDDTVKF